MEVGKELANFGRVDSGTSGRMPFLSADVMLVSLYPVLLGSAGEGQNAFNRLLEGKLVGRRKLQASLVESLDLIV